MCGSDCQAREGTAWLLPKQKLLFPLTARMGFYVRLVFLLGNYIGEMLYRYNICMCISKIALDKYTEVSDDKILELFDFSDKEVDFIKKQIDDNFKKIIGKE